MTDTETPNNKSISSGKAYADPTPVNPCFQKKKKSLKTVDDYVEGIRKGNRVLLSRAITLIESSKRDTRELGEQILEKCLPHTGNSVRIGITGVPGAGKSTFIEALGNHIIAEGRKLAVLAIDPSSSLGKGSILADKTHMQALSASQNVYIRPSPASGAPGGVTRTSRETLLLCEAAGYDTIFIETVGAGQSETAVHSMVDFFLLLVLAGAGDELQGIKRGVMEMADLVAVNKAEKENQRAAEQAKKEIEIALSLFPLSPSRWRPPVLTCSALEGTGIEEIWGQVETYLKKTAENGYFSDRRSGQAINWMHETINRQLQQRFYQHPKVKNRIGDLEKEVKAGTLSPFRAAEELLQMFESRR